MSVIRSPTQIHDGYATIRTRGQCRATSKYIIDRSERCRTLSFAAKTKSVNLINNRKSYGSDNSSSNASTTNSSSSGNGSNQICTTFRPLSVESGEKTSQFSLESLPSSNATPKTPDYINTIDDDGVFLYSEPESPNYANYSSYFSNIYATPKKCLPATSTTTATCNNHYKSPKNNSPIYSTTTMTFSNYRRPNMVMNNRKSSSVEILDDYSHIATDILESLHNSAEDIVTADNDYDAEDVADDEDVDIYLSSNVPLLCEKKFYTLGHTRRSNYSNHNRRYYQKSVSVPAAPAMEKRPYGRSCSSIANYNKCNNNEAEYMDPLDFKIGCQTTLRSKPIIPWYELAIKKDFRQSCPPITSVKSSTSIASTSTKASDAQVVTAFEQSLGNMTQRLQQLTATAERKDGELTDMRQTIELLKKQSIQAGLTSAHMQSMGVQSPQQNNNQIKTPSHIMKSQPILNGSSNIATIQTVPSTQNTMQTAPSLQRHHSTDSMCSINSIGSNCSTQDKNKKKKGWLRSSFTKAFSRNAKIAKTSRHHLNHNHHHSYTGNGDNSSKCETPPLQNTPVKSHLDSKLPKLPQPLGSGSPSKLGGLTQKTVTVIDNAKPIDAIDEVNPVVEDLKRQLREKDLVLTDTRLEALNSASQLESMKEQMNKMRAQMKSLKEDNMRLHKFYSSRSLAGSEVSLGNPVSPNGSIGENRRYSLADGNTRPPMELPTSLEEDVEEENIPPAPAPEPPPQSMSPTTHIDLTPPPPALETIQLPSLQSNVQHIPTAVEDIPDITDGKKISISVYLGQPEAFPKYYEEALENDRIYGDDDVKSYTNEANNEFIIAFTYISGKTTWQNLDYIVRKTFKDYLAKIDPGTNLGLNTDSITSYHLGDAKRGPEVGFPELLPCGYIIGNVRSLYICLQGVGSLAFDSLIPRSIVHRYISLLGEHRRLILCGPSGTGKSYLARRLAEFLVAKSGRENISEAIATFNVDHKSSKDLQEYLGHIAEQASMANGASDLPSVIILDNLHHASALGDVFSCLLSAGPASKLPCIIGTMSHKTSLMKKLITIAALASVAFTGDFLRHVKDGSHIVKDVKSHNVDKLVKDGLKLSKELKFEDQEFFLGTPTKEQLREKKEMVEKLEKEIREFEQAWPLIQLAYPADKVQQLREVFEFQKAAVALARMEYEQAKKLANESDNELFFGVPSQEQLREMEVTLDKLEKEIKAAEDAWPLIELTYPADKVRQLREVLEFQKAAVALARKEYEEAKKLVESNNSSKPAPTKSFLLFDDDNELFNLSELLKEGKKIRDEIKHH